MGNEGQVGHKLKLYLKLSITQKERRKSRGLFVIFVYDSVFFRNSTIFVKFYYILCKFNGHSLNLRALTKLVQV